MKVLLTSLGAAILLSGLIFSGPPPFPKGNAAAPAVQRSA
jgi:hypothetical protein